jgi:hypothetical protein
MSTPPRVTKEAATELEVDRPVEPNLDDLSGDVKTVLDLLAQLHEQTLALVEAFSEMNERTYQPAREFLRNMQARIRGGPSKE